ncbi:MAG: efflux RND transporter periplasmic adaptor subunit [Alphaproteobacteria bacterium]|nr:MAG: efflux RND transporter periplasmic adaptor subunit [Alphaproteobacteria bacterium]
MNMLDTGKPEWAMSKRERQNAARLAAGQKPRRGWGWLFWLLVVIALAAAGVWFVQSGRLAEMQAQRAEAAAAAKAEAEARAARAAIVRLAPFEVTTIAPATLTETLKITGSLEPIRQVTLSAEVTAKVREVSVREGDKVREGDLLVRFETDALDSALAQARANVEGTRVQLEQAKTDLERTRNLVERGISPSNALSRAASTVDQLAATLAAQETLVANAERARRNAIVTAPFDGVVAQRSVEPGQFVSTGSPLITVVDLSRLEIEATAPVSAAPDLAPGLEVDFRVEGFDDRVFKGRVERLAPVAVEGTRMLPVYVSLENPGGELRGGMFAAGRIVLEARANAIGVPAGAVREDGQGPYVLVIENGEAVRRGVEIARSWDRGAVLEIASGLAPGDVVVAEPLAQVKPGDKVALEGAGA